MSKETVNNDVDAFLSELETIDNDRRAERAATRGPRTVYEVIKPEMGKVYSGYTLISYNETTSPWVVSLWFYDVSHRVMMVNQMQAAVSSFT